MENLEENKKLLKIPIRKKINYMDGLRLNRAIISGVKSLISRQEYLNKINVFPVPDGDTGTNMAFTLSAVMEASIGQIEPRVDVYTKIISDACEAIIGAVFLDQGFKVAEKFILYLLSSELKNSIVTKIDAKTKLQELSLKNFKKLPTYKLISNTGPRHKPLFKVGVKLPNTKFYISSGNSKKDAEQNAAIECLKSLK